MRVSTRKQEDLSMAKLDLQEMLLQRLEQLEDVEDKDAVKQVFEKLDLAGVQRTIDNDYVNPIVKKTKEETVEKAKDEIKDTAVNDFIAGLGLDGVENVDGFKAYTKRLQSTTEEKDEIISKYEKELNEIKPQYEQTSKQLEKRDMLDKIMDKGFERKYAEDVFVIAKNKLDDDTDLDTVLDSMKDSYKAFVAKPQDGGSYDKGDTTTLEPEPDELNAWRVEAGLEPKN